MSHPDSTRSSRIFSSFRPVLLTAALLAAAVAVFAHSSPAGAATQTVDFEDLSPGTTVTNQYQPKGVYFLSGDPGFEPVVRSNAGARSGSRVVDISTCPGCEFHTPRTRGRLTTFATNVTVYAGNFATPPDPAQMKLVAFDVVGNVLATTPLTSVVAGTGFNTPLTVSTATPVIAYFEVVAPMGADAGKDLGFDDLTIQGPAVPPPADFDLTVGSAPAKLRQGTSMDVPISVNRYNGSAGPIDFQATNLPTGVTATFAPNPTSTSSATMVLTATPDAPPSPPVGVDIGIRAVPQSSASGPAERTAVKNIRTIENFRVEIDGTVGLARCMRVEVPVTVVRDLIFPGAVTLSASGIPAGVQSSFTPSTLPTPADGGAYMRSVLNLYLEPGASFAARTVTVTATSPGLPSRTTSFRLEPQLQTVEPTTSVGATQRRRGQGSEVTLTGGGFCPGSKVQFGNPNATSTERSDPEIGPKLAVMPTFLSADGRTIRARIPRLGSTGKVRVVNPDGTTFDSGQTFEVRTFRNRDGFPFDNYGVEWISWGEFTDLFGVEEMFIGINPCWPWGNCRIITGIPDPLAYLYWGIANLAMRSSGGHCFGISKTIQDMFRGKERPSWYGPPDATSPFDVTGPAGPTGSLGRLLDINHTAQTSAEFLHWFLGATTMSYQLSVVENELANGRYPALLLDGPGTKGHVVLAYDVEDLPDGRKRIYIYDNNHPYMPQNELNNVAEHYKQEISIGYIEISADGQRYSYPDKPEWGGSGYGVKAMPYGVVPDNPTMPLNVEGLLTVVFGSGNSAAKIEPIAAPSADGERRTAAIGPLDSNADERTSMLVADGNRPIEHSIQGLTTGKYNEALIGKNLIARLDGVGTGRGQRDRVRLDPARRMLKYIGETEKNLKMSLGTRGTDGSSRTAQVSTRSGAGEPDSLAFVGSDDALVYAHRGAPARVAIELSNAGPKSLPTTFSSRSLSVDRGGVVELRPDDWRRLDRVRAIVRRGDGRVTRYTLKNRTRFSGRFSVGKVKVRRSGKDKVAASVGASFRKVPAESQAFAIFRLMKDGRTVAVKAARLKDVKRGKHLFRRRFAHVGSGSTVIETRVVLAGGGAHPDSRTVRRLGRLR